MVGLYVHVPFCSAICNYCNFNRGLFDAALKARYVDALLAEIRIAGLKACTTTASDVVQTFRSAHAAPDVVPTFRSAQADTIYFGGGTPSLLEPDEIKRLISPCDAALEGLSHRYATHDANPESTTA